MTEPPRSGPPDLEARVAALETQVRDMAGRVRNGERDAAAARVLAGGADRDVTEFREEIRDFRTQNTRVLNAMREDLIDVRTDLIDVRTDLTDVRTDLTDLRGMVDTGFIEMRGRLDAAASGQQQIVELLNTLIDRDGQPGGE